jgi:uncharacterized membrane protein YozB (DUF420 family)
MFRNFISKNTTLSAIILFIILFLIITYIKPKFLYNSDGTIRQFGVGSKNKTILPLWLISIILGILCYLGILYYLIFPKINYN